MNTTCCIVGGGPAGMMLGYMLARRGVRVTVLEKHKDFHRDFRGDTVHPSTLEVLYELDLLDDFLKLPHQQVTHAGGVLGGFPFKAADFRNVPAHCKFVALMPQWDFLNFLAGRAKSFPTFDLRMQHEAIDLIRSEGRITGVIARAPEQPSVRIDANLVVGCDGRHSMTRGAADLPLQEFGVPIDVLWFRISREPDDPGDVLGMVNYGKLLILINRSDYFQAGLVVPKGSYESIKERGLDEFRNTIRRIAPYLDGRVEELQDWDQIKILTVRLDRLRRWYRPGLLCIGDSAHAMSPVGGIGINLAIQDAVAAANLLAEPLLRENVSEADLARVERRRVFPARITQAFQARAHRVMTHVFANPGPISPPWQFKAFLRIPGIQRVLGYGIGIGVRPEHANRPIRECRLPLAAKIGIGIAAAVAIFAIRRRVGKPVAARAAQ